MDLLVLGGTVFLGRHVVEAALRRGHRVTLFHRGEHGRDLFGDVERILGDRDGGTGALAGRRWDAVVDTSGYVPRVVGQGTGTLADATDHYTFVSSASVYESTGGEGATEDSPVRVLQDPDTEEVMEAYGELKAACEDVVRRDFAERALVVRSGLIVGPHDPSDRFTYWPWRIARGGDVLAPGSPECPVQWVDVRDLAAWIVDGAERRLAGTYNATGPAEPATLGPLLAACGGSPDTRIHWVDEAFLLEAEVRPFLDMPLWVPEEAWGFNRLQCGAAREAGLAFRPVAETVRDTLGWLEEERGRELKAGLSPAREAELLAAWGDRGGR